MVALEFRSKLVGRPVDIEPDISTDLSLEGLVVNPIIEDLGTTTWQ